MRRRKSDQRRCTKCGEVRGTCYFVFKAGRAGICVFCAEDAAKKRRPRREDFPYYSVHEGRFCGERSGELGKAYHSLDPNDYPYLAMWTAGIQAVFDAADAGLLPV